jgi:hypothetical protein
LYAELPALLELTERVGRDQHAAVVIIHTLGVGFSLEMGDFEQADRLLERSGKVAAEANNPMLRWLQAIYRCTRLQASATGDDVEQAATVALQQGEDAGQPDAFAWFATQIGMARILQGRAAEIAELARQQVVDNPGLPAWRAALADILVRAGELDQAAGLVGELMDDPTSAFPNDNAWLTGQCILGRAVSAVGTPGQAARQYEVLLPYAGRVVCSGSVIWGSVILQLANLAARAGWTDKAEQHFADAVSLHTRLQTPIWLAESNLNWGRFVLGSGETDRARGMLTQAQGTATEMGAADIASAAAALLAEGARGAGHLDL